MPVGSWGPAGCFFFRPACAGGMDKGKWYDWPLIFCKFRVDFRGVIHEMEWKKNHKVK